MASCSGGLESLCSDNEEMIVKAKELSDFIKTATFPICVCVVRGKHITSSVQLTKGDILFLKSCETKTLTLTHQDSDSSSGFRKQVNVPLDFPFKFNVLPPKNVSDRTASVIMYPSIADLLLDSPTYFEATSNYDDPYLPGFSIHRGDKFKFRGLVTDPKDGRERLKVTDELDNVLLLSLDCRANFYPLEDEDSYTLRQLIDFASVPRRLKIAKIDANDAAASFKSSSGDSGFRECFLAGEDDRDITPFIHDKDTSQLISFTGVIHLLKPNLLINASPVNDTDTVWKIPLNADLCVREHDLDDYEVPSVARNKEPVQNLDLTEWQLPLTPTFPAPSAPRMPQPLVPVDVFNFTDIYGCPVKAKIMDVSKCDISLQTLLHGTEEIAVYRLEKTKRLYAEDLKTNNIYSLARDLKVSFIEYPEKFSVVSELLSLPLGSEITVLEDIMSDYPRPILLQFGDVLRTTTNTTSVFKLKNSSIECKVLKCEKVNREGGPNVKMKLPLDFEVNMVLSVDHNSRRVICMDDLLSGTERFPEQEVAILIDSSEKMLQDLPINLKLLKFLPERILVSSPYVENELSSSQSDIAGGDWPSPTKDCSTNTNIGISSTSGLVLAFRERVDVYDVNVIKSQADAAQVPYEILSRSQFEERERLCKVWVDEEEAEVQSVASDDRSSTLDVSSQAGDSSSSRQSGKRTKSKKIDKIRRLSQVLNPKHWRPPRAAPEPLPHPEAMGLMALSMRPPSDQLNVYETRGNDEDCRKTSLVPTTSVSSDEDIYEDVEIGPLKPPPRSGSPPVEKKEPKGFTARFHKSMPLKQIVSRTYAKNRAKRREKSESKQTVSSPIRECSDTNNSFEVEDGAGEIIGDEDPFYDAPQPMFYDNQDKEMKSESCKQGYVVPQNNPHKMATAISEGPQPQHSTSSLPPLPPRRSASSLGHKTTTTVSKSMDSLVDQNKSSPAVSAASELADAVKECQIKPEPTQEPPVPPRRKRMIKSFNNESTNPSADDSNPSPKLECKSEHLMRSCSDSAVPNENPVSVSGNSQPESEDKIMYSSVHLQNKTVVPPKMPVPKPRGLKKVKTPEIPPKLDRNKIDNLDKVVKRTDSTGKDQSDESDKVKCDTAPNESESSHRDLAARANPEEPVVRKESLKPKPPPKPKPRIG